MPNANLQTFFSVTNSGGPVTTITTGVMSPSLSLKTPYGFTACIIAVDSGSYNYTIQLNGSTTDANYVNSSFLSNNTGTNTTGRIVSTGTDRFYISGWIGSETDRPWIRYYVTGLTAYSSNNEQYLSDIGNPLSQISITCATASKIGNGSYIRIWESIQST